MQTLRIEFEIHRMFPGTDLDGTQDVIGTSYFYRLTVYRSLPTEIINFREYNDSAVW